MVFARMTTLIMLAMLPIALLLAGCGQSGDDEADTVSVACASGVQYDDVSAAAADADVVLSATIDKLTPNTGSQQGLYTLALSASEVVKGDVGSRTLTAMVNLGCEGDDFVKEFTSTYAKGTKVIALLASTEDGYTLLDPHMGVQSYSDAVFHTVQDAVKDS